MQRRHDDDYGWNEDKDGGPSASELLPENSSEPAKKKLKTKSTQAATQTATEAVRALLAAAGMQLDATRKVQTTKAATKTAAAVANIQREGDSKGFAFFGGSMVIAHKIFIQVACPALWHT